MSVEIGSCAGDSVLRSWSTVRESRGSCRIVHREIRCANCGIVIRWQATIVDGETYCCFGCAQGGPCECDYDSLPPVDELNPMVLHPAHNRELEKDG
jgi:hypothetical protein